MLDFSFSEILLILVVAFIVFGPERLPEIAHKIGKLVAGLRRGWLDLLDENKTIDNKDKLVK